MSSGSMKTSSLVPGPWAPARPRNFLGESRTPAAVQRCPSAVQTGVSTLAPARLPQPNLKALLQVLRTPILNHWFNEPVPRLRPSAVLGPASFIRLSGSTPSLGPEVGPSAMASVQSSPLICPAFSLPLLLSSQMSALSLVFSLVHLSTVVLTHISLSLVLPLYKTSSQKSKIEPVCPSQL